MLQASVDLGRHLLRLAALPGDAVLVEVVKCGRLFLVRGEGLKIVRGDFVVQGVFDGAEEDVSSPKLDPSGVDEQSAEEFVGSAGLSGPVEDG